MRAVSFVLNGKPTTLTTDPSRALLWVLRDDLGLTGTKYGCGETVCGSCTVVIGKAAVRACSLTVGEVEGKSVTTIEGLASNGRLHPVQQAFVDHAAYQCGFCTPGMIMGVYAWLLNNPNAKASDVASELEPHICRCGAHVRILAAVETAAAAMKGRAQ